jgi:hypothetical protein
MADNPNFYEGYFDTGISDELFKYEIINDDLNTLTIRKIVLSMDILPYQ